MSRTLAALLASLALLAGALWYVTTRDAPTAANEGVAVDTAADPKPGRPGVEIALTSEAAPAVVTDHGAGPAASNRRETAPTALDEELDAAHWVEGRVVFPSGTPHDEQAWIVARGRNFSDGSDHRVPVARDGSFRVAFSERTITGRLELEGRYLYLPETVRWKRGAEDAVVLEPLLGGRLVVTVVAPPGSNRPLDGAVSLSSYEKDGWSKALEGATTVEWGGLPAATYSVTYDGGSLVGQVRSVLVEVGTTRTTELPLRLGVLLSGVVLDEHGEGVPEAWVGGVWTDSSRDPGFVIHQRQTRTDSEGRFRLDALREGEVRVDAWHEGFLRASLPLGRLHDGMVRGDLAIVLARGGSVSGTVTWPDGTPAEASIQLSPKPEGLDFSVPGAAAADLADFRSLSGKSGTDGRFTLTGLADSRYALLATASTKESTEHVDEETGRARKGIVRTSWKAELDDVGAGSDGLRVVLSTGVHLLGRVVDDLGDPVDRFTVSARRAEEVDGSNEFKSKSFRAVNGAFEMEGLSEGEWRIEADGTAHAASEPVRVTLPSTTPVELVLSRDARVRGVVLDARGEAREGVTVRAHQSEWQGAASYRAYEARTDDRGEFELDGLRAGRTTLRTDATKDAPCEPFELVLATAQQVDGVVLRMRAGGALLGRIVNPRERMFAAVIAEDGTYYGNEDPSADEEGRFEVHGLPPGTFDVVVRDMSGVELSERVTLGAGETVSVRLVCPMELTHVHGVVTAGGEALAGARVSVEVPPGETSCKGATARTGGAGTYAVTVPSGGTFDVEVVFEGDRQPSWRWRGKVDVPAAAEHVFDVSIALARVSGRLVDVGGAPLTDRLIGAEGDQPQELVAVDERGGFELVLPLGKYQLWVAPSARQLELGELLVERDLHLGDVVVRTTR